MSLSGGGGGGGADEWDVRPGVGGREEFYSTALPIRVRVTAEAFGEGYSDEEAFIGVIDDDTHDGTSDGREYAVTRYSSDPNRVEEFVSELVETYSPRELAEAINARSLPSPWRYSTDANYLRRWFEGDVDDDDAIDTDAGPTQPSTAGRSRVLDSPNEGRERINGWEKAREESDQIPAYRPAGDSLPFEVTLSRRDDYNRARRRTREVDPSGRYFVVVRHSGDVDRETPDSTYRIRQFASGPPLNTLREARDYLVEFLAEFDPLGVYDAIWVEQVGAGWSYNDVIESVPQPAERGGEYINDWRVSTTQQVEGREVPTFSAVPWGDADRSVEATLDRDAQGWYDVIRVRALDDLSLVTTARSQLRYDAADHAERTLRALLGSMTPGEVLRSLARRHREAQGVDYDSMFDAGAGGG